MRFLLISCLSLFISHLNGQGELQLSFWSDAMINANSAENRNIAFENFYQEFSAEMQKDNAFEFDFTQLPELTVLSDSLNTFKLISWQIQKDEFDFDYYGYLITKDGESYELKDAFRELEDLEYLELSNIDWLGGIYYNMVEMDGKYFLFSFRQLDQFTKFKAFDCLTFSESGEPILGQEIFIKQKEDTRDVVKNRVTFYYSADALLSLNYNTDMNMVVHDHLMEVAGRMEGQGPTFVPDGTYEGYKFEEGRWIYEEKLFHHTYDEAPRPHQILGNSKKDILGREKKN